MDVFMGVLAGLVLIIFASVGITTVVVDSPSEILLIECEKKLPRNEHCILIAVPEKGQQHETN